MTRVSDTSLSTPISFTFEPTAQSREFGGNVPDTISTAATEAKEGEGFFKRMICCIPRCILAIVQKTLCLLTLGYYCNTKALSAKERRENILSDLTKLQNIWMTAPTKAEKKAAGEAVFEKYPELKENIAIFGVNQFRRNALGHSKEPKTDEAKAARQKEIEEWNKKHFEAQKKEHIEALEFNFDAPFIGNYVKFFREQTDNA